MTGNLILLGALLLCLFFAIKGMHGGAFSALARFLNLFIPLLVALRCWHGACRTLVGQDGLGRALPVAGVFALLYLTVLFLFLLVRKMAGHPRPSGKPLLPVDRILGGVFGFAGGMILAATAAMLLSVALPVFVPGYKPESLFVRVDRLPVKAFRCVERHLAHVKTDSPKHTLLPDLLGDSGEFWR